MNSWLWTGAIILIQSRKVHGISAFWCRYEHTRPIIALLFGLVYGEHLLQSNKHDQKEHYIGSLHQFDHPCLFAFRLVIMQSERVLLVFPEKLRNEDSRTSVIGGYILNFNLYCSQPENILCFAARVIKKEVLLFLYFLLISILVWAVGDLHFRFLNTVPH